MTTMPRLIRIVAIRTSATRLVGDCSDYQILMVARHANVVRDLLPRSLEDLNDYDLESLANWMAKQ